ncbi:MAG: hypothetical protein R3D32_14860 [Nitratireductor sp.]
MTAIGFTRPELLSAVVDAWIETLKLISPGVVVCDNAPALQIAAKIRNIPTIALGTPYLMPPLDGPNLPAYDAHFSPVVDERQLLESAARIFAGHDKPPPKSMPSLLATDFRFVFGLPEIDPYLAVRRENLYLPLGDLPKLEPIPALPRYFVYLGADEPVSKKLFQAIADSGLPADIYMRDDSGMLARFLRRRGFNVFADPPKLDDVLPKVTHVISAGGAHVTQAAMLAGRHHIMLPRHEESWSNARMATRLKVASVIGQNEEDKAIRGKITSTVADHSLLHNAIRLATELAQRQNRSASSLLTGAIKRYCS